MRLSRQIIEGINVSVTFKNTKSEETCLQDKVGYTYQYINILIYSGGFDNVFSILTND